MIIEVEELTHVNDKPLFDGDRMYPFRKIQKTSSVDIPTGPSGGGNAPGEGTGIAATTMLAGGVIGAGIGMLIIDSLDKRMPWS
jgi:hypothetical protein